MQLYPLKLLFLVKLTWSRSETLTLYKKDFQIPPGTTKLYVKLDGVNQTLELKNVAWDVQNNCFKATSEIDYIGWYSSFDELTPLLENDGWKIVS